MSGPTGKTTSKKAASKKAVSRKSTKKASMKKQLPRDVVVAPTSKQVEQSIRMGKTRSLEDFRKDIDWL